MLAAERFVASDQLEDLARADAVFIAVPTPFDDAKTPDLTFVRKATETVAAVLHPGMLVILQSTTFPGTTTEVCKPILEQSGLRGRPGLPPGVLAGAGRPRQLAVEPAQHAQGGRWHRRDLLPPGRRAARVGHGAHRAGQGAVHPGSGRAGQAAREHLPGGQHRARQRAGAALPRDGRRPVGGHRGRLHQAVRLRGVHPGHRPRRALHPRRSLLPVVAGAGVRLHHEVHRAGSRHEPAHGRLRADPGRRRSSTATARRSAAHGSCATGPASSPGSPTCATPGPCG